MIKKLVVGVAVVCLCTLQAHAGDSHPGRVSELTELEKTAFSIEAAVLAVLIFLIVPIFRRIKVDPFVGELMVGVLLGPVLLAVSPGVYDRIFSVVPDQRKLLEFFGEAGICFLILRSGADIKPAQAIKHGRAAISLGVLGVVIPLVLGFGLSLLFFNLTRFAAPGGESTATAAWFLGNTMAVSSMVVIIRLLKASDLGRTELGQAILCGYAVNSILAWFVYGIVFQFARHQESSLWVSSFRLALSGLLTWAVVRHGPSVIDRYLDKLSPESRRGTVYMFVFGVTLLLAVVTDVLGVTRYYGCFLAGVLLAGSKYFSEEVKNAVTGFAEYLGTPMFFVSVGLFLDLRNFSISSVVFITIGSIVLKYIGGYVAAIPSGRPKAEWHLIGVSFTPGGVDGIIFGSVALACGLISHQIMSGIIVAAVISSILTGPLLKRALRGIRQTETRIKLSDFVEFGSKKLPRFDAPDRDWALKNGILPRLASVSRETAAEIHQELDRLEAQFHLEMHEGWPPKIAYLHCSLQGLEEERIFFFWSGKDVPWTDNRPVRVVVAHITPKGSANLRVKKVLMTSVLPKIAEAGLTSMPADAHDKATEAMHAIIKEVG